MAFSIGTNPDAGIGEARIEINKGHVRGGENEIQRQWFQTRRCPKEWANALRRSSSTNSSRALAVVACLLRERVNTSRGEGTHRRCPGHRFSTPRLHAHTTKNRQPLL